MIDSAAFFDQYRECFDHFIRESDQIGYVILDEKFSIVSYNEGFAASLGAMENLTGQLFSTFLLPESRRMFPLEPGLSHLKVALNIMTRHSGPISLDCHIYRRPGVLLIMTANILFTSSHILEKMALLTNDMANLMRELSRKNKELEDARSKIKVLGGIIPICMHCKKIRDDQGYWNRLEKFITENSEAHFSHSICDDCMNELYPDEDL
ncbi:hypothetical protein JCM14469_15160 [Desulfatiferula olefinivorans]